eukprot:3818144-Rhodomonas_salina.2
MRYWYCMCWYAMYRYAGVRCAVLARRVRCYLVLGRSYAMSGTHIADSVGGGAGEHGQGAEGAGTAIGLRRR